MERRTGVWLTRAAGAVLLLAVCWGAWTSGMFAQQIWSETGLRRLGAFTILYWAAALLSGRFLPAVLVIAGLVWAGASIGPAAVCAVVLILLAAYGVGSRISPGNAALPAGFAVFATLIGLLARFPVNTPALYALLAIGGTGMAAWRLRKQRPRFGLPERSPAMALALYLGCFHLLAALFPEVGSDALAVHLTVPAWVARHGSWHFDPQVFSWALIPMNGEWLFTWAYLLGGEAAARLLNVAIFACLGAVVFGLARRMARRETAWLAVALLFSTPVGYLLTGSLFVESVWGLLVCAFIAVLADYREDGARRRLLVMGLLAGAALSTKLLAAAVLAPAGAAAVLEAARRGGPAVRGALAGFLAAAALGLPPYLEAWTKTGNPVFPFFNSYFQSPLFSTQIASSDPRYPPALEWDLIWEATFHSTRFQDGQNGSLGLHYLLLLPASALLLRRTSPWLAWVCLLAGSCAAAIVFARMGYLRYVFPALALLCAGFAWTIDETARRDRRLGEAAVTALFAFVLGNAYLLSAASFYTRDFALPAWRAEEHRSDHVRESAPARLLVDYWNRAAPGRPVAFFDEEPVAGLAGRAYSASWRTWNFREALDRAESPGQVRTILEQRAIRHIVAPGPEAWFAPPHAAARGLLQVCGEIEAESGAYAAWNLKKECGQLTPYEFRRIYFDQAPAAGPGEHDDSGPYPRYSGRWLHDRQFSQASGHTITYTNRPGDHLELRFHGRRVRVGYTAAANRGVAAVYVDGRPAGRLDQFSRTTAWQSKSPFFEAGEEGEHRLRLELLKEPAGRFLEVDRFWVE